MQAIRNYSFVLTVKRRLNRVLRGNEKQTQIPRVIELDNARRKRTKTANALFARDPSNCASIQHIHTYDELDHKIDKKGRKQTDHGLPYTRPPPASVFFYLIYPEESLPPSYDLPVFPHHQ